MAKTILLTSGRAKEGKVSGSSVKNNALSKIGKAANSFKGAKPAFDVPYFQRKEERDWGGAHTFLW